MPISEYRSAFFCSVHLDARQFTPNAISLMSRIINFVQQVARYGAA